MKEHDLICTAGKWYTEAQTEDYFKKRLSTLNYTVIKTHLTVPEIAKDILGFMEQDGGLILFTVDGEIKFKHN